MKQERYCPSLKIYFDGDKQCHHHGPELICPLCGSVTRQVKEGEYKQPKYLYSLRELGKPNGWKGHSNGG